MIYKNSYTKIDNKNCFDFLRFFFAFQVVLEHISVLSHDKRLTVLSIINFSNIALKGFFIISGFLVANSYINSKSIKQYFIKRVKRVIPGYLVVVFFAAFFLFFASNLSFENYFFNIEVFKYIGWNSVFLNFVHPCLPGVFTNNLMCAVNGSLWTLKVEEGFYLILPLIFFLIFKFKKASFVLLVLYLLSFMYFYIFEYYFNLPLFAKQLPGYISYFSSGILLFIYFNKLIKKKWLYLSFALLLMLLTYKINVSINVLFPISWAVVVIVFAYSVPVLNKFGKYGDFTYGLYIYHFPIIQIFKQYDLFEKFNPFLMAFLVIILTFLFALFSWFLVEKRFLDRYKANLKNAS